MYRLPLENFAVKMQTVKIFAKKHPNEKLTTTPEDSQKRHTSFNHAVGSIRQVQFGWRCLPTQTAKEKKNTGRTDPEETGWEKTGLVFWFPLKK